MSEYLITFHTHYDSLVCTRKLRDTPLLQQGMLISRLIPVPRAVSSGCGTAVHLQCNDDTVFTKHLFSELEYDSIYKIDGDTYTEL